MLLKSSFRTWLFEIVDQYSIPLHLHAQTTKSSLIKTKHFSGNLSFIELAYQAGLLNKDTSIIDAIWTDQKDITLLANSKSMVIHNPLSDFFLGSGVFSMNSFLDAEIEIGLGTGIATGGNLNMFDVMKMVVSLHRIAQPDFKSWPKVGDVLKMAISEPARCRLMRNGIGKLEPGNLADIVLYDLRNFSFTPLNNIEDQLVCLETGDSVNTVIIDGKLILEGGGLKDLGITNFAASQEFSNVNMKEVYCHRNIFALPSKPFLEQEYKNNNREPLEFTRWLNSPTKVSGLDKVAFKGQKN